MKSFKLSKMKLESNLLYLIFRKLIEDFESNKNQSQKLANKNPSLARFNTMNESSICKRK